MELMNSALDWDGPKKVNQNNDLSCEKVNLKSLIKTTFLLVLNPNYFFNSKIVSSIKHKVALLKKEAWSNHSHKESVREVRTCIWDMDLERLINTRTMVSSCEKVAECNPKACIKLCLWSGEIQHLTEIDPKRWNKTRTKVLCCHKIGERNPESLEQIMFMDLEQSTQDGDQPTKVDEHKNNGLKWWQKVAERNSKKLWSNHTGGGEVIRYRIWISGFQNGHSIQSPREGVRSLPDKVCTVHKQVGSCIVLAGCVIPLMCSINESFQVLLLCVCVCEWGLSDFLCNKSEWWRNLSICVGARRRWEIRQRSCFFVWCILLRKVHLWTR